MSYSAVGLYWSPQQFREYLKTIDVSWAKGVTLHHMASPSLEQRPDGLTDQHMKNLQSYYENDLGWSAGPQLFVDDYRILGLSPMTSPGTHAKSFNGTHIGIEVLGNYDHEDPTSGRGLECWELACEALDILLQQPTISGWNCHRDDPQSSKTCPGTLVPDAFIGEMLESQEADLPSDVSPPSDLVDIEAITESLDSIEWQCQKIREQL